MSKVTAETITVEQPRELALSPDFHARRTANRALHSKSRLIRKANRACCAEILNARAKEQSHG